MPKLAYIQLYFDDFEHDTAHLDDELSLKYLRLMWVSLQHGGGLPDDDVALARLAQLERVKGWRQAMAKIRAVPTFERDILGRGIRRKMSRWVRDQLFHDSNGKCHWCQKALVRSKQRHPDQFVIDHRVPLAQGGSNQFTNLVASCRACNEAKGAAQW